MTLSDVIHILKDMNVAYPHLQFAGKDIMCDMSYCKVYEPYVNGVPKRDIVRPIEDIKQLKADKKFHQDCWQCEALYIKENYKIVIE